MALVKSLVDRPTRAAATLSVHIHHRANLFKRDNSRPKYNKRQCDKAIMGDEENKNGLKSISQAAGWDSPIR